MTIIVLFVPPCRVLSNDSKITSNSISVNSSRGINILLNNVNSIVHLGQLLFNQQHIYYYYVHFLWFACLFSPFSPWSASSAELASCYHLFGFSSSNLVLFILQDQYWAPPDFKRVLSAKLKFLTSIGKLDKVNRQSNQSISQAVHYSVFLFIRK